MKRWMALLSALAVFLALVWWLSRNDEPVEVPAPAPSQPPVASRPPPPPPRDELLVIDAPIAPAPANDAPPIPTAAPAVRTPRPPKNPIDPELAAREQALLERARQEVTTDPERALRRLREHRSNFPDPELARAVELVRLEAYLRLGKQQEAQTLARKLLDRDPTAKKAVDRLLSDVRQN